MFDLITGWFSGLYDHELFKPFIFCVMALGTFIRMLKAEPRNVSETMNFVASLLATAVKLILIFILFALVLFVIGY